MPAWWRPAKRRWRLAIYDHGVQRLKDKGAPINFYTIEPAFARVSGLGISSKPSNPHAAVLFYDYMLSPEGQTILARRAFTVPPI